MLIQTFLVNLLFVLISCRKRYRSLKPVGGRSAAGVAKFTQTFGKGVATFIKDIKQGNWGDQQIVQQYNQRSRNRFTNNRSYYETIGNDTQFHVFVACGIILIVAVILYVIIKVLPNLDQKDTVEEMRKRNEERFKHYETLKYISQNGVHPDRAFGRLQKIKYKQ